MAFSRVGHAARTFPRRCQSASNIDPISMCSVGGCPYSRRSFHAYPLDTQIRTSRRMSPDETALFAAEDELETLVGELSPEDFAAALAMLPEDIITLFLCERKGMRTDTTYELALVCKPYQLFLDLLATPRARKHNRDVVGRGWARLPHHRSGSFRDELWALESDSK